MVCSRAAHCPEGERTYCGEDQLVAAAQAAGSSRSAQQSEGFTTHPAGDTPRAPRASHGRRQLVGAVAAPQLLDRLVRAPGQLDRQVHAPACGGGWWEASSARAVGSLHHRSTPSAAQAPTELRAPQGLQPLPLVPTLVRPPHLRWFLQTPEACSEMPVEAASDTMATSLRPCLGGRGGTASEGVLEVGSGFATHCAAGQCNKAAALLASMKALHSLMFRLSSSLPSLLARSLYVPRLPGRQRSGSRGSCRRGSAWRGTGGLSEQTNSSRARAAAGATAGWCHGSAESRAGGGQGARTAVVVQRSQGGEDRGL